MYLKFFFSVFFSVKVLAVPPGEVFWEVVKPGVSTPNYLLGTFHSLKFRKDSLPAELEAAIQNSTVGLFEVILSERSGEHDFWKIKKRTIQLPEGETLSSYIGEKRTQELFSAFQFALSQLDGEEVSFLSYKLREFDLDIITSYRDFNSLPPFQVIALVENPVFVEGNDSPFLPYPPSLDKIRLRDKVRKPKSKPDTRKCLSRSHGTMDTYIEKVFSCMEKSVYSLENKGEAVLRVLSVHNRGDAAELVRDSDRIIRRLRGLQRSEDILHEEWSIFLSDIEIRVRDDMSKGYYLNHFVDTVFLQSDIVKTISGFLIKKQCSVLSDSLISQYAWGIINMYQLRRQIFSKAEQMTGEIEEQLAWLISGTGRKQRGIFSLCFPDFQWPEDLEEIVEQTNQFQLDFVKDSIEILIIPRDLKQAQSMYAYFEKGGAFAAVGFNHLNGVLRELRAQGYKVRQIPFSTPFKVPPVPPLYELMKTWGKKEAKIYYDLQPAERMDDIYFNPAKVEWEEGNPHMN